jgi:hypothetical protein
MRRILITAALLCMCACNDEDAHRPALTAPDAGSPSSKADAGKKTSDAGQAASALDKPGALARPPKSGLPAELRPPR